MPSTSKILMRRLERLEGRLKEPQSNLPTEIHFVDAVTGEIGFVIPVGRRATDVKGEKR